jgi:hypothetical protein
VSVTPIKAAEPEREESPELKSLRAERARLVEAREKREAAKAEADEITRLKFEIAKEEAITNAEATHGPLDDAIAAVDSRSHGVIIVKRPAKAHYRQMIDAVGAGKKALSVINEEFAFRCLVYPARDEFERILKEESGLLERVANAAAVLGGLVVSESQGK